MVAVLASGPEPIKPIPKSIPNLRVVPRNVVPLPSSGPAPLPSTGNIVRFPASGPTPLPTVQAPPPVNSAPVPQSVPAGGSRVLAPAPVPQPSPGGLPVGVGSAALGGAAATAIALSQGASPGQAVAVGVGTAAGQLAGGAIGTAVAGPIGTFVGSILGGALGGAAALALWNGLYPPQASTKPSPSPDFVDSGPLGNPGYYYTVFSRYRVYWEDPEIGTVYDGGFSQGTREWILAPFRIYYTKTEIKVHSATGQLYGLGGASWGAFEGAEHYYSTSYRPQYEPQSEPVPIELPYGANAYQPIDNMGNPSDINGNPVPFIPGSIPSGPPSPPSRLPTPAPFPQVNPQPIPSPLIDPQRYPSPNPSPNPNRSPNPGPNPGPNQPGRGIPVNPNGIPGIIPVTVSVPAVKQSPNRPGDCCPCDCPEPEECEFEFVDVSLTIFDRCEYNSSTGKFEAKTKTIEVQVIEGEEDLIEAQFERMLSIERQQCEAQKDAIAAVPEWWGTRINADRPQAVLQFAEVIQNSTEYQPPKWVITVPHWNLAQNAQLPISEYERGDIQGILTLTDNSKVIVHCKTAAECTRVLDAIKTAINPDMLPDTPYKVGTKGGASIGQRKVKLKIVKYFSTGQKSMAPTWVKYV